MLSPPRIFETDEDNAYFLCIISIHPLANSILDSQDELRRDEDNTFKIKEMKDVNRYLSLSVSELGDKEREAIRARINNTIKKVLHFCTEPKSNDEIFEKIELYKNTTNHNHHIKPLLEIGCLKQTIPDKPRSKNQKYYTTELGEKLLAIIAIDSNSGIKRIPVASSNIAYIGYDVENKILEIEFHRGAVTSKSIGFTA